MNFAPARMTHLFMKRSFCITSLGYVLMVLCLLPEALLNAQAEPDISVSTAANERVFDVAIEASDQEDLALMKRAFTMHGAFQVVSEANAEIVFKFNRSDANSVELEIYNGSDRKLLKKVRVPGQDAYDALLRSADRAVSALTGKPGFFAGKLAFIGETSGAKPEVYVSDFFFQRIQKLTSDGSLAVTPRWSPDGQKIIYTSYFQTGFPDIFLIDLASMNRSSFASFKGTNVGACFSPNGAGVAMVLSSPGSPEIYVADTTTRKFTRLTHNDSLEATPSWRADGSELVFTSDALGRPQLYRMSSRGGKQTRIKTNISGYCAEPNWNPADPDKIAFTAVFSEGFQVVLWEFSKNKCRILTRGRRDSVEPVWLNDGRHIVFTRRQGDSKQLMLLDSVSQKEFPLHNVRFGNASQADFVYSR